MNRATALLALALCAGCSKKAAPPRRTEPWLAQPSASSSATSGGVLRFRLAPESVVRFSLPGKKAQTAGQVPISEGTLWLDTADLTKTRANVEADLTKLSVDASALPPELAQWSDTPTHLALEWLEITRPGPARRADFEVAHFDLVALENLSGPRLELRGKRPAKLRATAVGTLLLHGYRAPVRAEVSVEAEPDSEPLRLSIRSLKPLVLPLAPHEIPARGAAGPSAATKADFIGPNLKLELELVALAATPK